MVDIQDIARVAERELAARAESERGGMAPESADAAGKENSCAGLFLVDVKALAGDAVEVFIDSDARGDDGRLRGVTVEDCVALTRAIEAHFDRDVDDFSLTVSSAGIGQPLRVPRQYRKLIGRSVEVVMASGVKITGMLEAFGEDNITLSYPEKRKAEGKKKPEIVTVTETFPLSEVKTTREYIDFK
jgi:ribosome maturation factor RimP